MLWPKKLSNDSKEHQALRCKTVCSGSVCVTFPSSAKGQVTPLSEPQFPPL